MVTVGSSTTGGQAELGTLPGGVPLAIAAKRLGVSVDAVRHRIKRGTVRAFKEGDRWYVLLPDQAASRSGDQVAGQHGDHVDDHLDDGRPTGQDATWRELVDQLRSEVEFLRSELVRKDQLLGAIAQLGPRRVVENQPRVSWWRRLFGQ